MSCRSTWRRCAPRSAAPRSSATIRCRPSWHGFEIRALDGAASARPRSWPITCCSLPVPMWPRACFLESMRTQCSPAVCRSCYGILDSTAANRRRRADLGFSGLALPDHDSGSSFRDAAGIAGRANRRDRLSGPCVADGYCGRPEETTDRSSRLRLEVALPELSKSYLRNWLSGAILVEAVRPRPLKEMVIGRAQSLLDGSRGDGVGERCALGFDRTIAVAMELDGTEHFVHA